LFLQQSGSNVTKAKLEETKHEAQQLFEEQQQQQASNSLNSASNISNNCNNDSKQVEQELAAITMPADDFRPHPRSFNLDNSLGSGGTGSVYRAKHIPTGSTYAVKVYSFDTASSKEKAYKYFIREVRIFHRLRHPNIVHFYGMINENDINSKQACIVMECMDSSLTDWIDTNFKPDDPAYWKKAIDIALQVTRGLAYLHYLGILHGDLKPQNILTDTEAKIVKLCDFGTSKQVASKTATKGTAIKGTLAYMAPEMFDDDCKN